MRFQLVSNRDEVSHHDTLEAVAGEIARRYADGPATFSARLFDRGSPASQADADAAQRLAAMEILRRPW